VAGDRRLKAGGLDPLVLKYLKDNADTAPHGAGAVTKALERSSGAVGNCLVRLTEAKKVKQDSEKPRRYSLAA
jgi:acetate kinase